MFSIYTSAFNVIKNKYAWEDALINFSDFADEVVVAVNTSQDDSLEVIKKLADGRPKIKVIETDFSYYSPTLDGDVKNAALQATSIENAKIGLDLDERIPLSQRPLWEIYVQNLYAAPAAGSLMIPVVNLYGDEAHYKDIGQKWYLHKHGLFRKVVDFARNPDGTHDITKSDSCELTNEHGQLIQTFGLIPSDLPDVHKMAVLETGQVPFVVHYGYVDFQKKILRNKNFWKNHWKIECGHDVDTVPLTTDVLEAFIPIPHKLKLC